jgi:hypothetical protein
MAKVYLARHPRLKRRRLKMLKRTSPRTIVEPEREVQLRGADHPTRSIYDYSRTSEVCSTM